MSILMLKKKTNGTGQVIVVPPSCNLDFDNISFEEFLLAMAVINYINHKDLLKDFSFYFLI